MSNKDRMIPVVGVITKVTRETADVNTYQVEKPGGGKLFEHMPGQCAFLSVPGLGEAIFSITSSPTRTRTIFISSELRNFSLPPKAALSGWSGLSFT